LSDDGRFRYLGGTVPLDSALCRRAMSLGQRAVEAVDGLLGYVGVDLVLGESADHDWIIEINPRPTTSYLGLRALSRSNLAETILRVARGQPVAPPSWRPGARAFRAGEGHIAEHPQVADNRNVALDP
jgi:predicted ATP-grasp superfamily ATP-dependent carboligase